MTNYNMDTIQISKECYNKVVEERFNKKSGIRFMSNGINEYIIIEGTDSALISIKNDEDVVHFNLIPSYIISKLFERKYYPNLIKKDGNLKRVMAVDGNGESLHQYVCCLMHGENSNQELQVDHCGATYDNRMVEWNENKSRKSHKLKVQIEEIEEFVRFVNDLKSPGRANYYSCETKRHIINTAPKFVKRWSD